MQQRKRPKNKLQVIKKYLNGENIAELLLSDTGGVLFCMQYGDDYMIEGIRYNREQIETLKKQLEVKGGLVWIEARHVAPSKPPENVRKIPRTKNISEHSSAQIIRGNSFGEEKGTVLETEESLWEKRKQYLQIRLLQIEQQERIDLSARGQFLLWKKMQSTL